MSWFIKCLKNYVNFKGRARRKEFWFFTLFCFLIGIVAGILDSLLGLNTVSTSGAAISYSAGVFGGLTSLALLLPSLAVSFRRLHDIGKSGVNILFGLIPLAGIIILIVFFATEGKAGENEYGPNPKEVPEA